MRRIPPLALVALLCASSCAEQDHELGSTAQASSTGSTVIPSTGQTFDIAITSPADGATVPLGLFSVQGNVAIGSVAGTPVNVLSVADLSGSTGGNAGMDCNGDGIHDGLDDMNGDHTPGDILDCEISGVVALNTSLFGTVSVDVGIIGFGTDAVAADMQAIPGQQTFTAPPEVDGNGNGLVDHEEVARSLDQGHIGLFTPISFEGYTNFDGALATLNAAFAEQPAGEQSLAFFLSDGNPCGNTGCTSPNWPYTGLAGPLADAKAAGTVINTFAVGTNVIGCVPGSPLQEIADETNGTCTEVSDPTDLHTALPGLTPSGLDRVEVNGVAVPVDPVGNFSLELVCTAGEVIDIVAVGYADDVDGTVVQADISVNCCEDTDGDGICDGDDVCPLDADNDADGDGICGDVDNCPAVANPDQADADGDGVGDVCDVCPYDADNDADADGVCGDVDNCPDIANPDQSDDDGDGFGDACDSCPNDAENDGDDDGVCSDQDNCPDIANPDQADADGDGVGDVCDDCPNDADNDADADGVCGDVDLCAGTTIPESVPTKKLLVNRWALVDDDGVFDTVTPSGEGPALAYTIEDTAGCSCEQIIEALDLGIGHSKFGCSISAMDDWIASLP